MKNNQFIERYGEKALELYHKKTLKDSAINYKQQFQEDQGHLEKKKSYSKKSQRNMKSKSQKSLNKTSKSKSKINLDPNDNLYTFQKPLNLQSLGQKDKNRKKLIISGLSTPKNKQPHFSTIHQGQRGESSSTKKKNTDLRITQKLNDALYKAKTTKNIVKQLLQCLDMISQHQIKINKWLNQFKDIVYHIADRAVSYRKKYKQQAEKNKKLLKQLQQLKVNGKINGDKKRKPIQMVIVQQNQKLRQKIGKLQQKIQNFEKKQMVLIGTLQKIKNPSHMNYQTHSTSKRQQNSTLNNIKRDFYGSLEQNDEQQQDSSLEESQENL